MKHKVLLLALFLFFLYSKAQQNNEITEGEVEYYVVFGSKKNPKLEEKISDSLKLSKINTRKIFDLISSGKGSEYIIKFKDNKALAIPEIAPEIKTKKNLNITKILLEKRGVYYADLSENVVYNDKIFRDENIIVKYNISDLQWNITDKTKVINGYKATKATAKYKFEKHKGKTITREVVAWFSEDIPIQVAPMQFYGLPGLVVSLEAKGMSFTLSSIRNKKVDVDYKINTQNIVSENQYIDMTNEID